MNEEEYVEMLEDGTLYDYITNLQQIEKEHQKINGELRVENKKLQEESERLKEENNNPLRGIFAQVNDDQLLRSNAMNYAELQDYKSRNEKAMHKLVELQRKFYEEDYIIDDLDLDEIMKVLDNGGDKNWIIL